MVVINGQPIPLFEEPRKLHPSAALTTFQGAFVEAIDSSEAATAHNETARFVDRRERAARQRLRARLRSIRREFPETAGQIDQCLGDLGIVDEMDDHEDFHRESMGSEVQRIWLTSQGSVRQVEAQLGAKVAAMAMQIERELVGEDGGE